MGAALEDCLGAASAQLERIPTMLVAHRLSVGEYHALMVGAREVLDEARIWMAARAGAPLQAKTHDWVGTPTADIVREPIQRIRTARNRLARSVAVRNGTVPAEAVAQPFTEAARLLRLGRDVMRSHFDADGAPLTDYGRMASTPGAHRFVVSQMGEVCHRVAMALRDITAAAPAAVLAERPQLGEAVAALDRAVTVTRSLTKGAPASLTALPVAAALTPVALNADETSAARLRLIADGAERILQGADRAARRPDAAPEISGSDLIQIARPLALAHLLAGRVVHTVGPAARLGEQGEAMATALREAAQAWQGTGQAWTRIVDLGDSRAAQVTPPPAGAVRPKLYQYGHSGRPASLPRPPAHPAVAEAQLLAVRVGRLLFAGNWLPERPGSAMPRPPEQILADVGGPGSLLSALQRVTAAGAALAERAPALLGRIAGRLVTDDEAYRPREHPGLLRWFPASAEQVDGLTAAYSQAAKTSAEAAARLEPAAHAARTMSARSHIYPVAARGRAVQVTKGEPLGLKPQQGEDAGPMRSGTP
jgi:hypothetical protein